MPLKTVEWNVERAVRERCKPRHTHVDTDRFALRNGLFDLAFGLDTHMPFAARQAHGNVLDRTQHLPAVAVTQPAELGQEDATVTLIEFDLLRIGVAEAIAQPLLLEAREVRPLSEEVAVGPLQVLERLLQRVHRRIREPRRIRTVTPFGEQLAQPGVAELLFALLVALLLQRQCLVEHEPARASEAAHLPLLLPVWHQFVLVGLKSLHGSIILLVYER